MNFRLCRAALTIFPANQCPRGKEALSTLAINDSFIKVFESTRTYCRPYVLAPNDFQINNGNEEPAKLNLTGLPDWFGLNLTQIDETCRQVY
ncbi:hypothetical protein M514_10845, partial [Trichuris suis]